MQCPVCEQFECRRFERVAERWYWRCERCQATFLDPSMLPPPERELSEYLLHQNDPADAGYRQFLQRLVTPLLERLPPASHGLDYGCGPGPALAAMLKEAGHHAALYDPFFHPDATVLEQQYDFIACAEVIEHFHRPSREFTKLDAILKPGGILGVMTRFLTDDTVFSQWHYRRDPTHVTFYREETFQWIAARYDWHCDIPCANVAVMTKVH